jgi:hypothetical protein
MEWVEAGFSLGNDTADVLITSLLWSRFFATACRFLFLETEEAGKRRKKPHGEANQMLSVAHCPTSTPAEEQIGKRGISEQRGETREQQRKEGKDQNGPRPLQFFVVTRST